MLRHFFSCENEIEFPPLDFYTNKIRNFLAIEFIFFTRKWKKNHIQNTEKRKAVSSHQVYFKLLRGDDDSAGTHRNSLRRCFSDPPPIDTHTGQAEQLFCHSRYIKKAPSVQERRKLALQVTNIRADSCTRKNIMIP